MQQVVGDVAAFTFQVEVVVLGKVDRCWSVGTCLQRQVETEIPEMVSGGTLEITGVPLKLLKFVLIMKVTLDLRPCLPV